MPQLEPEAQLRASLETLVGRPINGATIEEASTMVDRYRQQHFERVAAATPMLGVFDRHTSHLVLALGLVPVAKLRARIAAEPERYRT